MKGVVSMANLDIRLKCRANGIPLWMLADVVGISEATLFRWLRRELEPEKKSQLMDTIDRITSKH